jgi:hypothetical protein
MQNQLSVKTVGNLIVARLHGVPTEALLEECQQQVLRLVGQAGHGRVLYDAMEIETPPVDLTLVQRKLDQNLGAVTLRRAIVVPNSRLAFLARLAFGESDYRVFYGDLAAAALWLEQG